MADIAFDHDRQTRDSATFAGTALAGTRSRSGRTLARSRVPFRKVIVEGDVQAPGELLWAIVLQRGSDDLQAPGQDAGVSK